LLNPNKTVAVTSEDRPSLQTFVQNGGSLVLATDFSNANVLMMVGIGALFVGAVTMFLNTETL